jgi:transcriptional regulator with XRE-family HTH domain
VAPSADNNARPSLVAVLAERRRALGLRQVDVAAIIGVGQQEVSNWERGHSDPRLVNLERYAAALGGHVAVVLPEGSVDE